METEQPFFDRTRNYYLAARGFAVGVSLVAGSISVAVGAHRLLPLLVDYGPAIVVKEVDPIGIYYQSGGTIYIKFDKIRPCLPKSATIVTKDEDDGSTHVGAIQWTSPYPVANNISAEIDYTLPRGVDFGYHDGATLTFWHYQCADGGGDPKQPVTVKLPGFIVSKKRREEINAK
jgi:hypothetical protein